MAGCGATWGAGCGWGATCGCGGGGAVFLFSADATCLTTNRDKTMTTPVPQLLGHLLRFFMNPPDVMPCSHGTDQPQAAGWLPCSLGQVQLRAASGTVALK